MFFISTFTLDSQSNFLIYIFRFKILVRKALEASIETFPLSLCKTICVGHNISNFPSSSSGF